MGIQLINATIRSPTRIRLTFTGNLASGAFATTPYVIGYLGTTTTPVAALQVSNSPFSVELVMSDPVPDGETIDVQCTAVPGADSSTFTGDQPTERGVSVTTFTNVESKKYDADTLLFGRDLAWANDYVEGPNGDLQTIEGLPNVCAAIPRRIDSSGLLWDSTYGAYIERFVDGSMQNAQTARATIMQQVIADDRVQSCTCDFVQPSDDPADAFFRIQPYLKSNRVPEPFNKSVVS